MTKKRKKPIRRNPIAKILRTSMFRKRIVEMNNLYKRKEKHPVDYNSECSLIG